MIVSKSPSVAQGLKLVSLTILVAIGDACSFCLLGYPKRTVSVGHAEDLIQPAGERFESRLRIFLKNPVGQ